MIRNNWFPFVFLTVALFPHRFGEENIVILSGAAEGVLDWSDHLRKASTRQLLVRPKFKKYETLTANGKIFGPTKVGVVGLLPPALLILATSSSPDTIRPIIFIG